MNEMNDLTRTLKWVLAAPVLGLALAACGDDDGKGNGDGDGHGHDGNEVEIITEVTATFSPQGGGADVVSVWEDPDGDGGMPPTASAIALTAGETYDLSVELRDTLNGEDITEEIEEEAEEHQIFFEGSGVDSETFMGAMPLVVVDYADVESDYVDGASAPDLPVGLAATVTATVTGSAEFVVLLQHQPPVNRQPVKTAGSGADDGETDVRAVFPLQVN